MLKSFWEHIGVDIKRSQHSIGRIFEASSEWIGMYTCVADQIPRHVTLPLERERKFFQKEIADNSREVATDPGRASRLVSHTPFP